MDKFRTTVADKLNGKTGRMNGKTVKVYQSRKGESILSKRQIDRIRKETE